MKPNANQLNISESELLEYINKKSDLAPCRPAGFGITAQEFSTSNRMGHAKSKRILEGLVKSGELKVKEMRQRFHVVQVFYK